MPLSVRPEPTPNPNAMRFALSAPVLGDMVARFGDAEAQKKLVDILFLPLIWSFFHVIKASFSTPLGALSDRIGRKRSIQIGWAIYAFVYLSFALMGLACIICTDKIESKSLIWHIMVLIQLFCVPAP